MGSFFTNVQVHTGGRPAGEVHQAIVATLRAQAAAAGLEEDDALDDEVAERAIYLAPVGPQPWIAVYDSATEDQDTEILSDLGRQLSRVGSAAVTVLVHDSDVLEMRLFRGGQQEDRYNSYPDYFEEDPDAERQPVVGDAERWRPVLAPGATPDVLRAAWGTPTVFAEEIPRTLAPLLGWDPNRCGTGFRYLSEVADDVTGFTRLAFRPSAATVQGRPALWADGPPRFEQAGWSPEAHLPVGGTGHLSVSFRSAGGPGRGVQLVLWGPALDQGLIDARTVRLYWQGDACAWSRQEAPLQVGNAADGTGLRHARLEDVPIPAGLSEAALGHLPQKGPDVFPDHQSVERAFLEISRSTGLSARRLTDFWIATTIGVGPMLEGVKRGVAEVYIGIVPLENQAGQTSQTVTVTVGAD